MWRDEGEDFTLTPDSSHTFLTLWQLNDNTVNLALSAVYEEDIFLMGKKKDAMQDQVLPGERGKVKTAPSDRSHFH